MKTLKEIATRVAYAVPWVAVIAAGLACLSPGHPNGVRLVGWCCMVLGVHQGFTILFSPKKREEENPE